MRIPRHAIHRTLFVGVAMAVLVATACDRERATDLRTEQPADASATNVPSATPPASQSGATGSNPLIVATAGASAPYIANSAGTALYALEGDTDGSKCVAECTQAWPPMLVEDALPSDSPGLVASMVGVVQRPDGSTQVAYNGHPLYRYGADTGAGQTAGHGVSDKWGDWSLVNPQGARAATEY